jgi:methylglutamate dehydrogenase subunit D
VPSCKLAAMSSLGPLAAPAVHVGAMAGVTLEERTGVSLCSVLTRKDSASRLVERVRQEFGVELPRTPKYTGAGPVAFIWAGPGQWLAMAASGGSSQWEQRLRSSLAGAASVMDQSDGRTVVRISGPHARDALAKGVHIDLHPSAFAPGDTALTSVAYMNVHFWQIDVAPTYEFAIFRSSAVAFWEWLANAAAEYGVVVVERERQ